MQIHVLMFVKDERPEYGDYFRLFANEAKAIAFAKANFEYEDEHPNEKRCFLKADLEDESYNDAVGDTEGETGILYLFNSAIDE